jgi:hypothetical protein
VTRRRLTVRRIDPWSVLKFGAVANVVLLLIWLLVVGVVFYIVDRIGLVDQVCDVVLEVGFEACGVNAGNLFRAIALLGLLGVVILTAVLVFLSFLHNLIADLTGGLTFTVNDDSPVVQRPAGAGNAMATTGGAAGTRGEAARTSGGSGRPPVPPLGSDRPADRGTGQQEPAGADRRDGGGRPTNERDRRDTGGSLFGGHCTGSWIGSPSPRRVATISPAVAPSGAARRSGP